MTGQFRIIETGWRTDGLFIVILGGETQALLESESAHEFARILAERRRCKKAVKAEPVMADAGNPSFRRTFCFAK